MYRDKDPWRDGSTLPIATTRDTYKKDIASSVGAPAWDVMEHKVLRFFAYFNEHVDESRLENYRSRPVEILYYLEDDTMAVVEPKIDNSGMRSGTLIKRHRFPRADETEKLVSPADLRVGTTFIAYGKTFALTACDAFTREWYRKSGMSQPSDYSSDFPGSVHPNQLKDSKGDASLYVSVKPTTDDFHKRIDSPEPVCRFYAYFDDNFTNKLERRMYTILYFPRYS
ncbi:hypothetical protein ETH_00005775 [Eimeria tenella]|uniref:DM10 domain-containing protein n=1 Tax=Eimeria tenella TaxID=5802 RepID=U6KZS5_EIMTE|nr:hypothetical protein ETH_00005775 [Eimeria tenella]CDJ40995.1 hypothetical protein ETH_00005775 [Eimeria tenella]|eukprot:XP_013231745.1 hypothetical protein ETH_00005775 [Eimeria tenella]